MKLDLLADGDPRVPILESTAKQSHRMTVGISAAFNRPFGETAAPKCFLRID